MKYTERWDLTTIPEDVWGAENGRRMAARRKIRAGGRPTKVLPCKHCHAPFSARELRAHQPHCKARKDARC